MHPLAQTLQQCQQNAIAAYRAQGKPYVFFHLYSNALDNIMRQLCTEYFSGSHWCVLAIGGYGRGEVYPHSDTDLAFITREELSPAQQESIEKWVQQLWALGLKPAVQSGSLAQLLHTSAQDLSAQTAFLEARYVVGDPTFAAHAITTFRQHIDAVAFIENKCLEMQQRHTKQPVFILEPNIKNGAGGLRDLHTIKWLALAQGLPNHFFTLLRNRILTRNEAHLLHTCHRRLARLRIELHWAAGREEDRLIFDFQEKLAKQFGLCEHGTQAGIEQLMRIFYRTAKTVMQLNGILLPMLRDRVSSRLPRISAPIDTHYYHVNGMIAAKNLNLFQEQPEHIFIMIQRLQECQDAHDIAPKTLRAWWAATQQMDDSFYQNPENRQRFLGFFQAAKGLTRTLRLLNLYGVLSRYLPKWRQIVGLLQHDLFHIYPVDDHILTVLHNMRRFAMERYSHEWPFASALFQNFPKEKQYVLYLAALFHDIAKGRNGDHAILGEDDAQHFAADHALPEDDAQLLCWLVRDHLLMSITAQKEDFQDPVVLVRFCRRVGNIERLQALYLLTIADIRGTNPKIWNSWKAQLLQSLFQAAEHYFLGERSSPETTTLTRRQKAQATLESQGKSPAAIRQIMHHLGEAYFVRHPSEHIMWHLSCLNDTRTPMAAVSALNADTLQVLIFMPNAHRLFTRLCRIFSRHGLNIAAARAFITAHDFILDTFTLTIPNHSVCQSTSLQAALLRDLQHFAQQPFEPNTTHHTPSRRVRLQPIMPHVRIYPDDSHPDRHNIEIIAADRPYLLADITEIFAQHRISLIYAKISTLGERAEDNFIVIYRDLNASKTYALTQDLRDVLR